MLNPVTPRAVVMGKLEVDAVVKDMSKILDQHQQQQQQPRHIHYGGNQHCGTDSDVSVTNQRPEQESHVSFRCPLGDRVSRCNDRAVESFVVRHRSSLKSQNAEEGSAFRTDSFKKSRDQVRVFSVWGMVIRVVFNDWIVFL